MGQCGYINIVNKTDSRLIQGYISSFQMDAWDFPKTIEAGSIARVFVEWDECIFHVKGDDRGKVIYHLASDSRKEMELEMYNALERNIIYTLRGFNGVSSEPQRINWVNEGIMTIEIGDAEETEETGPELT